MVGGDPIIIFVILNLNRQYQIATALILEITFKCMGFWLSNMARFWMTIQIYHCIDAMQKLRVPTTLTLLT